MTAPAPPGPKHERVTLPGGMEPALRIVVRHLFLVGLELFGELGNGAGQLFLASLELFTDVRIVADQ